MSTKLENLDSDCFSQIIEFLSSSFIARLYFCGSRGLFSKLSRSVTDFKFHPSPRKRHDFPKIVSCFSALRSLELIIPPIWNATNLALVMGRLHNVDLTLIPGSVTSLKLDFFNAWLCLLDIPKKDDGYDIYASSLKDLPSMFPHLRSLILTAPSANQILIQSPTLTPWARHSLNFWMPLYSLPLTTLELPEDLPLLLDCTKKLPISLTSLSFTAPHIGKPKGIPLFPPNLTRLAIHQIHRIVIAGHTFPRTLTDLSLEIFFFGPPSSIYTWVTDLPPNLLRLSFAVHTEEYDLAADAEFLSKLPSSLIHLACDGIRSCAKDSSSLPRGLLSLDVGSWRGQLSEIGTKEILLALPPKLTSISGHYLFRLQSKMWAYLPRSMTNISTSPIREGTNIVTLLTVFPGDLADFPNLPPMFQSIALLECTPPSLSHLRNLTSIKISLVRTNEQAEMFDALSTLSQLTSMTITKFIPLEDPHLLNRLTCSLTRACLYLKNSTKIDFGAKWANRLEYLFLEELEEEEEEEEAAAEMQRPNVQHEQLITLPATLTHLEAFGQKRLLENLLELPLHLTVLAARPFPLSLCSRLPQSITRVEIHCYHEARDDVVRAALSQLPLGLHYISIFCNRNTPAVRLYDLFELGRPKLVQRMVDGGGSSDFFTYPTLNTLIQMTQGDTISDAPKASEEAWYFFPTPPSEP
jgi:hypothetical protein